MDAARCVHTYTQGVMLLRISGAVLTRAAVFTAGIFFSSLASYHVVGR
jgi:hypothetical protein